MYKSSWLYLYIVYWYMHNVCEYVCHPVSILSRKILGFRILKW
jgi:hypothetical protein